MAGGGSAGACAQTPVAVTAPKDAARCRLTDYQIGPEDVLDIAVWNNPAMSRTTPVRPGRDDLAPAAQRHQGRRPHADAASRHDREEAHGVPAESRSVGHRARGQPLQDLRARRGEEAGPLRLQGPGDGPRRDRDGGRAVRVRRAVEDHDSEERERHVEADPRQLQQDRLRGGAEATSACAPATSSSFLSWRGCMAHDNADGLEREAVGLGLHARRRDLAPAEVARHLGLRGRRSPSRSASWRAAADITASRRPRCSSTASRCPRPSCARRSPARSRRVFSGSARKC